MIVVCSSCSTRYLVPDTNIGAEGRTVRCANCSHEWFQELDHELDESLESVIDSLEEEIKADVEGKEGSEEESDLSDDDELSPLPPDDDVLPPKTSDLSDENSQDADDAPEEEMSEPDQDIEPEETEDIPESIKPDPEEQAEVNEVEQDQVEAQQENLPAIPKEGWQRFMPQIISYGAAALLVLLCGVIVFMFGLFSFAPAPVDAKGLVFDRFHTNTNKGILGISGYVLNMSGDVKSLPSVKFSLLDGEGTVHHSWVVSSSQDTIDVEESVPLEAHYDGDFSYAASLHVTFVPPGTKISLPVQEIQEEDVGHKEEEHNVSHEKPHKEEVMEETHEEQRTGSEAHH